MDDADVGIVDELLGDTRLGDVAREHAHPRVVLDLVGQRPLVGRQALVKERQLAERLEAPVHRAPKSSIRAKEPPGRLQAQKAQPACDQQLDHGTSGRHPTTWVRRFARSLHGGGRRSSARCESVGEGAGVRRREGKHNVGVRRLRL